MKEEQDPGSREDHLPGLIHYHEQYEQHAQKHDDRHPESNKLACLMTQTGCAPTLGKCLASQTRICIVSITHALKAQPMNTSYH